MTVNNRFAGLTLCAHCRTWRDPSELQAVQRLATGVVRYVCRREVNRRCWFDGIGPADVDRLLPGEVAS
jgi:hypothetical protein